MSDSLDLDAIKARYTLAANWASPAQSYNYAASLRDVPALVAEVERLQAETTVLRAAVKSAEQGVLRETIRVCQLEAEWDDLWETTEHLKHLFREANRSRRALRNSTISLTPQLQRERLKTIA